MMIKLSWRRRISKRETLNMDPHILGPFGACVLRTLLEGTTRGKRCEQSLHSDALIMFLLAMSYLK